MSENSVKKEEYEVLAYSKLNHVKASIVQIVNRNTHVHRALELGLALEGSGQVRVGGNTFPIGRGSLFFFNANEPHEIYAASQAGIRIAYLQVATSFCSEYVSSFRNLELLQNDLTAFLPRQQHEELVALMVRALMDYMSPFPTCTPCAASAASVSCTPGCWPTFPTDRWKKARIFPKTKRWPG